MKPVQTQFSTDNNYKSGFSLIELMIVISLFAIITIMATISYISFEGGQRLKNGALQIKNDLRLAQSSAQSGDKGAGSCATVSKLTGWYLIFDTTSTNNTLYKISGVCLNYTGGSPDYADGVFNETVMNLPIGVSISSIEQKVGTTTTTIFSTAGTSGSVSVLFKPLDYNVVFYIQNATNPIIPPDFTIDASPYQLRAGFTADWLIVTLSSTDGTYKVLINSSGQISESKT